MNILVLLHSLLDPAGFTINRRAQKVFVNHENYILNPSDKNALEAALQLIPSPVASSSATGEGQGGGSTVTAVALGDSHAADALRQARSMGAHRAILIQDPTLKQADAFVVTNVLRGVAQHLGDIDLVLLGAEVLDADLAQVGPRLATALDWPFIADAHAIAPSRAPRERYRGKIASGKIAEHPNGGNHRGPGVAVIVKQPDGFHQLTADLPAVISVAVHSNKPRYPHGRAIVDIYRAPEAVEILAAADLRLTAADLTPLVTRRGESFPPERELGKRLEGGLDEVANQLANVIRMK